MHAPLRGAQTTKGWPLASRESLEKNRQFKFFGQAARAAACLGKRSGSRGRRFSSTARASAPASAGASASASTARGMPGGAPAGSKSTAGNDASKHGVAPGVCHRVCGATQGMVLGGRRAHGPASVVASCPRAVAPRGGAACLRHRRVPEGLVPPKTGAPEIGPGRASSRTPGGTAALGERALGGRAHRVRAPALARWHPRRPAQPTKHSVAAPS